MRDSVDQARRVRYANVLEATFHALCDVEDGLIHTAVMAEICGYFDLTDAREARELVHRAILILDSAASTARTRVAQ